MPTASVASLPCERTCQESLDCLGAFHTTRFLPGAPTILFYIFGGLMIAFGVGWL